MRTLAELILEWLGACPRRTASSLSRLTGVPRSTISCILSGQHEPDIKTSLKLAKALPKEEVAMIVIADMPEIQMLIDCQTLRCNTASTMQMCS